MNPKKWKNDQKTKMWKLAQLNGFKKINKADIGFLKDNLNILFRATAQKTAGQRENKKNDIDWNTLDITLINIAIGAACLYKSGLLDNMCTILNYQEAVEQFNKALENIRQPDRGDMDD